MKLHTFNSFNSKDNYKLGTIEDIKKFMLAGKAIFTLESVRTGRWFTYQIKKRTFKKEERGKTIENTFYFVSVLTGSENESSYTYMGTITPNFYFKTTKKSRIGKDALSYKAFDFFTSLLKKNEVHDEINFYHKGICGKCGKTLTTPTSVEVGLGPVCRGYQEKDTLSQNRKRGLQKLNRKIMDKNR